ncbi:MAG: hypothetical protein ACLQIB_27440 [Isosphaeraceae bacterium]
MTMARVHLVDPAVTRFDRIGTTAQTWHARLEKLSKGHLLGHFFAASRQRLREVAQRLGLRRVPNLGGRPAA